MELIDDCDETEETDEEEEDTGVSDMEDAELRLKEDEETSSSTITQLFWSHTEQGP